MILGSLVLVPVPLGEEADLGALPRETIERCHGLSHFIAENAKSARAALKRMQHPKNLREIVISECNEHTRDEDVHSLLEPIRAGFDQGVISECGVPCVADPGSKAVAQAHREGVKVIPLVGPSSLLLALMASGLSGQSFEFVGYLPAEKESRVTAIRELERDSKKRKGQTKIFIETPYRAEHLFNSLLEVLHDQTLLCVAADLHLSSQVVLTQKVQDWEHRGGLPSPFPSQCVFLLSA